jgi:hypothetical protein
MNAHMEEVDGFTAVETNRTPPPGAQTLVIPEVKSPAETPNHHDEKLDLNAVPSGPMSHQRSLHATETRKAPVLP